MAPDPTKNRRLVHWGGACALIVGVWAWFCWPLLVGSDVVGFRDSGYLYYPLFQYIDRVWQSGQVPLWNSYDGLGRPLLADGSASVFYPGKVLFLFRFLDFDVRYGWYLALHLLLAALSTLHVARRWGASSAGAIVASLSYAFSTIVLFQLTNVIYLVGAAWLPWGLLTIHQTVRSDGWHWPWLGGIVGGMILLGGDPQTVYHLGLIGAATAAGAWFDRAGSGGPSASVCRRIGRLGLWTGLALGLAAVQVFPTAEWARHSQRRQYDHPRNVYETIATAWSPSPGEIPRSRDWCQGLFGMPTVGTHAEQLYQFSQPPWTVVEFALPNVGGRPFPQNGRWFNHLPGADRMWIPSLYLGLVGLVFAGTRFRLWKGPGIDRWFSRIAVFFLIASFGWYGPVWLVREMTWWLGGPTGTGAHSTDPAWGAQVGGLYWAMVTLLPEYVLFRYPAKLVVIACLAFSLLAGRGITHLEAVQARAFYTCWVIAAVALVVIGVGIAGVAGIEDRFDSAADPLFGPLQQGAIGRALVRAGAHSVVVSIAMAVVIGVGGRRAFAKSGGWRYVLAGLITIGILDLAAANVGLLGLVPSQVFHESVPIRYRLAESPELPGPLLVPPDRVSTRELAFQTARFAETSSVERLSEIIRVQRAWAIPKWHLAIPATSLESFSSIEPTRSIAESSTKLRQARDATERAFHRGAILSLATTLAAAMAFARGLGRRRAA